MINLGIISEADKVLKNHHEAQECAFKYLEKHPYPKDEKQKKEWVWWLQQWVLGTNPEIEKMKENKTMIRRNPYNPSVDEKDCPSCGEMNYPMGNLGKKIWYRCRACGMEYFKDVKSNPDPFGLMKKNPNIYKNEHFEWKKGKDIFKMDCQWYPMIENTYVAIYKNGQIADQLSVNKIPSEILKDFQKIYGKYEIKSNPYSMRKLPGRNLYRVASPSHIRAYGTTRPKAEAQMRILKSRGNPTDPNPKVIQYFIAGENHSNAGNLCVKPLRLRNDKDVTVLYTYAKPLAIRSQENGGVMYYVNAEVSGKTQVAHRNLLLKALEGNNINPMKEQEITGILYNSKGAK